jgi:hypothetical protein
MKRLITAAVICLVACSSGLADPAQDRADILRGFQLAGLCFKGYPLRSAQYYCLAREGQMLPYNNALRLGFSYQMFIVSALNEEMVRIDPTFREKRTIYDAVRTDFVSLLFYQGRVQKDVSDLCLITATDCSIALRLATYWRQQPLTPELQKLLE